MLKTINRAVSMGDRLKRQSTVLFFDAIIFLICLLGIYHIKLKAGLPFELSVKDSSFVITKNLSSASDKFLGAGLLSIDQIQFSSREEIEVYLDSKKVGDHLDLKLNEDGIIRSESVQLISFYSNSYLLIVTIIGTLFFIVAVFVLLKSHEEKQAQLYHAIHITTAAIMMTTWGNYAIEPYGSGIFLRLIFHLAYAAAPAIFLHFVFVFPSNKESENKKQLIIFYSISALLFLIISYFFLQLVNTPGPEFFSSYVNVYNLYRLFMIFSVIYGIILFIINYKKSVSIVEKKKIKWLLLGFILGPGCFILFWVIPQAITTYGIIPEEYIIILMSAIPITFGISIYKYHLLDIDFLINRSTVYGIVLFVVIIFYVLVVGSAAYLLETLTISTSIFISAAAAILVGLAFQPLKNKVQNFIDKKFFRVNYDFKTAHKHLVQEIKDSLTIEMLTARIKNRIEEVLKPEKLLVKLTDPAMNFTGAEEQPSTHLFTLLNRERLSLTLNIPLADSEYIEPGFNYYPIGKKEYGYSIIIPVISSSNIFLGFIALGKRLSLVRYNFEDIDFLNDVAYQASLTIERLNLQKELLLKYEEAERLKELNEMKSFFVSSVSHELKTPLASIILWTDILKSGKSSEEQSSNSLEIIKEEGKRLTRLIDNVLDYSRIEKGLKYYNLENINFNRTVSEALRIMSYQLKMNNYNVQADFFNEELIIRADKDAVIQAIINLLSNAIKYAPQNKDILIKTFVNDIYASVDITDHGIGISPSDLGKIFEKYFRSDYRKKNQIPGTGIGLSIVKNIMDSHDGKIKVESKLGIGSTFTLMFPRVNNIETFINN